MYTVLERKVVRGDMESEHKESIYMYVLITLKEYFVLLLVKRQ